MPAPSPGRPRAERGPACRRMAIAKLEQQPICGCLTGGTAACASPRGEVLCRHAERLLRQMHQAEAEMAGAQGWNGEAHRHPPRWILYIPANPDGAFQRHRSPGLVIRAEEAGTGSCSAAWWMAV